MNEIDKLKRLVNLAAKAQAPREDLIDKLLHQIATADAASFVALYEQEQPSADEILRVINRYTKALRSLRTR